MALALSRCVFFRDGRGIFCNAIQMGIQDIEMLELSATDELICGLINKIVIAQMGIDHAMVRMAMLYTDLKKLYEQLLIMRDGDMEMRLSDDFTLQEMLESSVARADKFYEQWTPPLDIVKNLQYLCVNLLQPLRNALGGPINVSSGYRCSRLNASVGGKEDSQHLTGEAADCEYYGEGGNQAIIDKVIELGIPFDQMIDENNLKWVHLSCSANSCRMEKLG